MQESKTSDKRTAVTKKYEAMPHDEGIMDFIREATGEQLDYIDLAFKILNHCEMSVILDYTDDMHLEYLTNALISVKDNKKFIDALSKAETDDEYLKLEIPDNETLEYYISDGQDYIRTVILQ